MVNHVSAPSKPPWWRSAAFRITAIYLVLAGLWILFSDEVLEALVSDPHLLSRLQTLKGWLFVIITGGILYLLIARDMKTLRKSEGTLRAIIDSVSDAIVVVDKGGQTVDLNQAALDFTGLERKEQALIPLADAAKMLQIRYPDGLPVPLESFMSPAFSLDPSLRTQEGILRRADGRDVNFLMSVAPVLDEAGELALVVAAFRDITEFRRLERLRDEFLSAVAHELKTPVTTIKGYAQVMRKWPNRERDPRELQMLETINAQCDRINRRVEEMLEVESFRAHPPELHRERFDLGELAYQVVQQMQSSMDGHPVNVVRENAGLVEADRERIDRVLTSLLENAARISSEDAPVEIRVRTKDGQAVASVISHETIVPEDRQAYVFEPFFEPVPVGHAGYSSVVFLGLYLSRLVVEHHGGRVWFESGPDRGSAFLLSLPLADQHQGSTRPRVDRP